MHCHGQDDNNSVLRNLFRTMTIRSKTCISDSILRHDSFTRRLKLYIFGPTTLSVLKATDAALSMQCQRVSRCSVRNCEGLVRTRSLVSYLTAHGIQQMYRQGVASEVCHGSQALVFCVYLFCIVPTPWKLLSHAPRTPQYHARNVQAKYSGPTRPFVVNDHLPIGRH